MMKIESDILASENVCALRISFNTVYEFLVPGKQIAGMHVYYLNKEAAKCLIEFLQKEIEK